MAKAEVARNGSTTAVPPTRANAVRARVSMRLFLGRRDRGIGRAFRRLGAVAQRSDRGGLVHGCPRGGAGCSPPGGPVGRHETTGAGTRSPTVRAKAHGMSGN